MRYVSTISTAARVAVLGGLTLGWLMTPLAEHAAAQKKIPERVLRTLEAQTSHGPMPQGGQIGKYQREAMKMLPSATDLSVEQEKSANAIASPLTGRLEGGLRKTFSTWQRGKVKEGVQAHVKRAQGARKEFLQVLAKTTGLKVEAVQELVPAAGLGLVLLDKQAFDALESAMKRKLTKPERDTIAAAEKKSVTATAADRGRFAYQVGTIVGVGKGQVEALLPR